MNKIRDWENWQRYLLVGVGVLILAIAIRLALLQGFDTGTANLAFIAVFVLGMVIYWALSPALTHFLVPLFHKLFHNQEKQPVVEIKSAASATKKLDTSINISIQQYCEYTCIVFARHLTKVELTLLCDYIQLYSDGLPLNEVKSIKVTNLGNGDLYHYCWNMWYHFRKRQKQDQAVAWLKAVFANLRDIEFSTIRGKLTIDEKDHYEIPLCKDIAEVLNQQHLQ